MPELTLSPSQGSMNSATGVVDLLMVTEESVMIVIETYDVFIIAK